MYNNGKEGAQRRAAANGATIRRNDNMSANGNQRHEGEII
jgi:hypothetical protein